MNPLGERLVQISIAAAVAYTAFQPLAPGPAVGAALTLLGLYLVRLAPFSFPDVRRDPGSRGLFTPALPLALAVLGAVFLAALLSKDPTKSWRYAAKYWHLGLIPAVASIPAAAFRKARPWFLVCGGISAGLAALAGLLDLTRSWNFKWDVLSPHRFERDRQMLYGFFDHHMTYAGFLAVLTFALAGIALYGGATAPSTSWRRERWLWGLASLLGGFLLVAARKRAYWIGGALGLLALVLRLRRRYLLLASVLLASVFAIGYLTPGDFRMRIDRAFAREDNVERIGFWRAGVAMFQERPFFGWGPGGYRLYGEPFLAREFSKPGMVPSYRENFTHVHNVYLQLLVDGGLVLFASYLSLLGYFLALTLRDLWQRGRSEAGALGAGMFAALVTLLFAGLFECNLMDKEVVLQTFFALGTYLSLRSGQAES